MSGKGVKKENNLYTEKYLLYRGNDFAIQEVKGPSFVYMCISVPLESVIQEDGTCVTMAMVQQTAFYGSWS
jgi:hypothetical protein